ncbi:CarboxypepD_reg-like domain-containing protein [Mucilaginibacter mallensis]|uniref:CarboxypepD_reg-like domain-containing protein n=1 Tax=Mucilaginibacter mallensis TaxID=652787 RepID=A0A1H1ZBD3_MUCMA|nr:DUF5686 and carboxypeptidase-like regulatory domain-containing protein [Mucilaginibacter mallensis]SDT30980.1 CarboxypepD_reg-like domain-containing protein [Mucilaginibacter mallensis]
MDCRNFYKRLFFLTFFLFLTSSFLFAQNTVITGVVTDAGNRQPLIAVTVSFPGTSIGTNTDAQGKFTVSTNIPTYDHIKISYVGYKEAILPVVPGKTQVINVKLFPEAQTLKEVDIKSGKKVKYRNKDNPAVELIRQVIAHKKQNRPESYPYVEYKEYDKMVFSFVNVNPKITEKKFFRKYKFVIDNRDTTSVPGKSLLPIYVDEKIAQIYYRKSPEKTKTTVLGEKHVDFGGAVDSEGIGQYFKHMYADIDIYDNSIFLMTNNFLSPIAESAPTYYKFFITDTLVINNTKVVELSFTPRNTTDMLFEGKIYVTLDGHFAVQHAKLYINKNINLNFVKTMHVNLDFEQNPDERYHLSKSTVYADFGLTKSKSGGLYGIRTRTFGSYAVNKPHPDTTYIADASANSDEVKHRTDQFWVQNRLDTLTTTEYNTYHNIDSLKTMPSYKRTMDIATLLLAGYKSFDWFELGPANTFYSFDPVEGFRLRVGGRTTPELSKRYYFETYAAYGFKDEKWKYFLSATYSLNNKTIYKFPQDYIRASVQKDVTIPGEDLQFVQEDNFLLSFKRGNNDKYLYNAYYRLDYKHEYESHFSYEVVFTNHTQSAAGSLYFNNVINGEPNTVTNLTTSDVTTTLRYAPNEQYYQGKIYRTPIPTKYPIFQLNYTQGINNLFNSSYSYAKIHAQIDKRFYLSQFGFADVRVEGAKIFGQVPYPLLNIFRANQTYAYDLYSYNLMNFLEFVGDHNESINIDQHFQGYFFNKIPLLKKLKWREVASFKGIYGGLSDKNDPLLHPALYQFPVDGNGQAITHALGSTPYIEGSVGVENIFKFVRVDLVRRFTYLDYLNAPKWGVRVLVQFDF